MNVTGSRLEIVKTVRFNAIERNILGSVADRDPSAFDEIRLTYGEIHDLVGPLAAANAEGQELAHATTATDTERTQLRRDLEVLSDQIVEES